MPFDMWLRKHGLSQKILYQSRPSVKIMNDQEWLERVYTIPRSCRKNLLTLSGRDDIFTKPLRTKDNPDNNETRVCWLGEQVTLPEALDRKKTVGSRTLGLEVGSRGIGVRIYIGDYTEVVKHILPQALAELECKRRDQKIYEMRGVPPWVAFDLNQSSMNWLWSWEVD